MARPLHSEATGHIPPAPPIDKENLLSWAEQLTTFLGEAFKVSGFAMQSGTVTLTAGAGPEVVTDVNVTGDSRIVLSPTTAVAGTVAGVLKKISTWTSSTAANPFAADEFLPVDGASTTATYTPAASGNSVLIVYMGGAWAYGDQSVFGLKLYYDGAASTQLCFFENLHDNIVGTRAGVAIFTTGTTSSGTDPVRVQASSVAFLPALLTGTERTLAVLEFNNSGGGGSGISDVFVDTKTVANGSFNINWTGTALGTETYDYVIMHKEISA